MNPKRIRQFLAATLFATLIVCAMSAGAGQNCTGAKGAYFIERFDQDGDRLVSAEEFASGVEDKFARLDRNSDGYLDAAEAPQRSFRHRRHSEKGMTRLDADGNGRLSPEEFPGPADHFTRLDEDGDGFLDAQELRAAGPCPRNYGCRRDDTDGDGQVSRTEFSGPAALFDRVDANADGFLTREEAWPGCRNPKQTCPLKTERSE